MKTIFAVVALAASAFAQTVNIGFPLPGQNISAGSSVNVQVEEGRQLDALTEIGIAVTLQHCQQNPCEDVSEDLGTIFFAGPFQPQNFQPPASSGEPYQNFTVNIPSSFAKGPAVFSVPHAALFGLGPEFFTQISNVTVNIV
ncbi:hypothetical protein SCHPADRAFT_502195 [Schizopora paradoxa]|uniref:Phosphatidylglycerol/phosphatidylinositol transfer protein n=1 Tax=Schizopora paradoxa TaxID=27342 RepID=A0A0H2RGR1_9AGAM|nr:hypothetical protein SCHPADRAFT_502195 [Schizopora paradoxa]